MIKGLCEIELKDESGNIVQKTYDENMITSGIERYFDIDFDIILKLLNKEYIKNHYYRLTPIIQKLIGGVYLYNKVQEESIDNIIPDPFSLVGSGSLCKSQQSDERCGLWNIDESSILYNDKGEVNGFKFVWDFLTSKGNGTIKSVSLTTDIGARSMFTNYLMGIYYFDDGNYIGPQYPFNLINPIVEKQKGGQTDVEIHGGASVQFIQTKSGICGSYKNNIIVIDSYDSSTKLLTYIKYKIKNNISINDIFMSTDANKCEGLILIDKFTVNISDWSISTNDKECFAQSNVINGFLYITYAYNKKIMLKKINLDTFEVIESVNRTFEQGGLNMPYFQLHHQFGIIGNYYVFHRSDVDKLIDKICILNRTDLTIVKEIDICKCKNPASSSYGITYSVNFGYIGEMLVIIFYEYNYPDEIKHTMIMDKDLNFKISNINATNYKLDRVNVPIQCDIFKYPYLLTKHYYCISQKIHQQGNTLYISANTNLTIDNLQTPVTKTASQTMKVIYTIKDVEETT